MPKKHLTDRTVAALQPDPGATRQIDYWDDKLANFCLRVSPRGTKTWCVYYRRGRQYRHKLGTYPALSLHDARRAAQEVLREVALGRNPAEERRRTRNAGSWRDLSAKFLSELPQKRRPRTRREYERIISRILDPQFGSLQPSDVTRPLVREFLTQMARRSPVMANRTRALISNIANFAIRHELLSANPCSQLERIAPETSRERVLKDSEIRGFFDALSEESPLIQDYFELRFLTAQRGGELLQMRWSDVDFDQCTWTIPGTVAKNRRTHRLPLSKQAMAVLHRVWAREHGTSPRRDADESYVFTRQWRGEPKRIEHLQKAIERIRRRAELMDMKGHDIRRTATTLLARLHTPKSVGKKILNHREGGVFETYDRHSYDQEMRSALQRLADLIVDIRTGRQVVRFTLPRAARK